MPDCRTNTKTVRQCTQTRTTGYSQCTQTQTTGSNQCTQTQTTGSNQCTQTATSGYNSCNSWGTQCTSWGAFSWLCKAFESVCLAWVWISSVVCVAWTWVSYTVCVVWTWVSYVVCVAWTWVKHVVCVAWAVIVFVFVSICCAHPLLKGLAKCWLPTKDTPRNPVEKEGWILTFEDDFDAGAIDYTKWRDSINWLGRFRGHKMEEPMGAQDFAAGKVPLVYYSPEFTFGPSTVKLIADNTPVTIKNPDGWPGEITVPYTLQALQWTNEPYWKEQFHGYFEIRCKTQDARDMWPAFWLYSRHKWPPEIDIFEFMSRKPSIFTTTHHWGNEPGHPSEGERHRACRAGKRFHIYACEWDTNVIRWYLDNKLIRTTSKWGIKDFLYPMSVIVNSGIDFKACREPEKSRYPNYLEVDYVRAYRKK
ncbi:MAG TPA: family 16 glycosylhydrolase [Pyrinomonadaceae bacterium]|nr:family 16 glycosylhydrolase [Pyrinomonadaceae bacterium]